MKLSHNQNAFKMNQVDNETVEKKASHRRHQQINLYLENEQHKIIPFYVPKTIFKFYRCDHCNHRFVIDEAIGSRSKSI